MGDSLLELVEYNVYRDGELIATTTENTFVDSEATRDNHRYVVTALYNRGESMPSNELIAIPTSIGDLIKVNDKETVYYNLQGQRVVNPTNGVFIEMRNNVSRKVKK